MLLFSSKLTLIEFVAAWATKEIKYQQTSKFHLTFLYPTLYGEFNRHPSCFTRLIVTVDVKFLTIKLACFYCP